LFCAFLHAIFFWPLSKEEKKKKIIVPVKIMKIYYDLQLRITERSRLLEQYDYYKKKVQSLKEKPPKDPSKLPSVSNQPQLHIRPTFTLLASSFPPPSFFFAVVVLHHITRCLFSDQNAL
jgi:hypothetical protein